MNDRIENVASMVYGVLTYFADNLATLTVAAPALEAFVAAANDHLVVFEDNEMEASEDLTGVAMDTEAYFNSMRDMAVLVSGGLVSYFTSVKDNRMARQAKVLMSQLDQARDVQRLIKSKRIIKLVTPLIANVTDFGVTASIVGQLNSFTTSYRAALGVGPDEHAESEGFNELVGVEIKVIMAILYIIDGIMETFKYSHPALYLNYKNVRAIYDRTGGSGMPPTVADVINPGEMKVVYTAADYNPNRQVRFDNLHPTLSIPFGLSTVANAFSNPPRMLQPGKTSVLLSSTLGPNGTMFVFHNTSAEPIPIEIRVLV